MATDEHLGEKFIVEYFRSKFCYFRGCPYFRSFQYGRHANGEYIFIYLYAGHVAKARVTHNIHEYLVEYNVNIEGQYWDPMK